MIAQTLMMFMTRYTKGSRHSAEAATLTLRLAYRLLDDLQPTDACVALTRFTSQQKGSFLATRGADYSPRLIEACQNIVSCLARDQGVLGVCYQWPYMLMIAFAASVV